jgi:hypothetical protein
MSKRLSDERLLADVNRVIMLSGLGQNLTSGDYTRLGGKFNKSTIFNRFGTWEAVLAKAEELGATRDKDPRDYTDLIEFLKDPRNLVELSDFLDVSPSHAQKKIESAVVDGCQIVENRTRGFISMSNR